MKTNIINSDVKVNNTGQQWHFLRCLFLLGMRSAAYFSCCASLCRKEQESQQILGREENSQLAEAEAEKVENKNTVFIPDLQEKSQPAEEDEEKKEEKHVLNTSQPELATTTITTKKQKIQQENSQPNEATLPLEQVHRMISAEKEIDDAIELIMRTFDDAVDNGLLGDDAEIEQQLNYLSPKDYILQGVRIKAPYLQEQLPPQEQYRQRRPRNQRQRLIVKNPIWIKLNNHKDLKFNSAIASGNEIIFVEIEKLILFSKLFSSEVDEIINNKSCNNWNNKLPR